VAVGNIIDCNNFFGLMMITGYPDCIFAIQVFFRYLRRVASRSQSFWEMEVKNHTTVVSHTIFEPPTYWLSVVIPAYNEEQRLRRPLEKLHTYLKQKRYDSNPDFATEVIVVDDGSRDGSAHKVGRRRHESLPCVLPTERQILRKPAAKSSA